MFPDESITREGIEAPAPVSTEGNGSLPDLNAAAPNATLTEDVSLAVLKRLDLPAEIIERLSKNALATRSRRVKLAIIEHPKTPRHISLPMVRHLFTFDLMQVALTPATPADIKKAAEDSLINRLETISEGERLSLAHRASGGVAKELLLDLQPRVVHAALENPRLTEASVVRTLLRRRTSAALVQAVCHHPKWSLRGDIRIALLRNEHTPLRCAAEFARTIPPTMLCEVLHASTLPAGIKSDLLKEKELDGQ
jgi:hypothetical protein